MRRASWKPLGMIVTRLPWMAQSLALWNRLIRYASEASCRASMDVLWKQIPIFFKTSWVISLTRHWKGAFPSNRSVPFWYFCISRRAAVSSSWAIAMRLLHTSIFLTKTLDSSIPCDHRCMGLPRGHCIGNPCSHCIQMHTWSLPPIDLCAVCLVLDIVDW